MNWVENGAPLLCNYLHCCDWTAQAGYHQLIFTFKTHDLLRCYVPLRPLSARRAPVIEYALNSIPLKASQCFESP